MSPSRALAPGLALCGLLAALLAALAPTPGHAADLPPLKRSVEAGASWGRHTEGYGDANGQVGRFAIWREDRWAWHAEAGRSERFGDRSLDGGLSYAHWFGKTSVTLGASSGTGDYIANRYRLDAAVARPIAGVVTTLGYTRIQSKGPNRSDGAGLGLVRYTAHWIYSAQGRVDWGQPGDTRSTSGGLGLTYVVWGRTQVGVGYDFGRVSYEVVSAGRAHVDYRATGWNLGFSQRVHGPWTVNGRLDYGETPFYLVRGASLGLHYEW